MSVISDIENIYEFSKQVENKDFKDFAKNLLCFCEEQKEKTNINNIDIFDTLIKKQFSVNEDKNYQNILTDFIEVLKKKGFIDYDKFYNHFILNFKTQKNEEDNSLSDSIVSELSANANFSKLLKAQKAVENMEKDNNEENLEQDLTLNENKEISVTPEQMIAFIKDEKTLMFPFSKESTLENKDFMRAFYKDLNSKSKQELEMLLAKIRAKNEALRAELLNLKQENTQEKIVKELEINSNLKEQNKTININELNAKLEKSKENLKQSRKNYSNNKWFLFNKKQKNNAQKNEE